METELNNTDRRFRLVLQLFTLCNRMQTQGDKFYEEITFKQVFLLSYLHSFGNYEPTLQELSEVMGCSRQNTKVIAQKLCDSGYIDITPDDNDKRKQRVRLTSKADKLEHKYENKDAQLLEMLFNNIDCEKLDIIKSVLDAFDRNLEQIANWCDSGRVQCMKISEI